MLALGGCGSDRSATPAASRLEREDFAAVARASAALTAPVAREVAATKNAWPLVAHGITATMPAASRKTIADAAASAASVRLPALLGEAQAASLTGPASHVAGLLRSYVGLSARGWRLIAYSLGQLQRGTPAGARFARQNVALYIESVYDAHFGLAQLGKQLLAGYEQLGGAGAFGSSLTQAEVQRLSRTYCEANDRLHPHTAVRLGS